MDIFWGVNIFCRFISFFLFFFFFFFWGGGGVITIIFWIIFWSHFYVYKGLYSSYIFLKHLLLNNISFVLNTATMLENPVLEKRSHRVLVAADE